MSAVLRCAAIRLRGLLALTGLRAVQLAVRARCADSNAPLVKMARRGIPYWVPVQLTTYSYRFAAEVLSSPAFIRERQDIEQQATVIKACHRALELAGQGRLPRRPLGKLVYVPGPNDKIAKRPAELGKHNGHSPEPLSLFA